MSSLRPTYTAIIKKGPYLRIICERAIDRLILQGVLPSEDARAHAFRIAEQLLDAEESTRDPNEEEPFLEGLTSYVRMHLTQPRTTLTAYSDGLEKSCRLWGGRS